MKRFFLSALSLSLLVACSTDSGVEGAQGAQGEEVQFSASVTRAYDTVWESNDRVGIFATGTGVSYANCQYLVDTSDSSLSAVASTEKIYTDGDGVEGDITYFAYYPYSAYTSAAALYNFDLSDQSTLSKIDLLWAAPVAKSEYEVELTFKHMFVKLNFAISSSSSLSGLTATLHDSYSAGMFDLATGDFDFTAAEAIAMPLIVSSDELSATATMLVSPMTAAELNYTEVIFTAADGTTYSYEPASDTTVTEWESGCEYTYDNISL